MCHSWWEQRHWCVTTFMETLLAAKHPFAAGILAEFEELQPSPPSDLSGYRPGKAAEVFQCGSMQIGFDSAGAIGHLKLGNGTVWASAGAMMNSVFQLMHFVFKMMNFVLTVMTSVFTMMNFVLKVMVFVFKMQDGR